MPEYHVRDPQSGQSVTLRGDSPPTEQELEQIFKTVQGATPKQDMSGLERLTDLLPAVGGTIGGFVGKVPVVRMASAAIGGAAGQGYKELFQHLSELPGAVKDVGRNLITQPGATVKGFAEGAASGAKNAIKEGAIQGGAQAIGEGVTAGVTKGAKAVYRGYLKPSIAAKNAPKAKQIVDTAIREGLPISRSAATFDTASGKIGGKAGRVLTELQGEVDAEIKSAGGTIDLKRIADRVRRVAKQKYFQPGADPADYKAALDVADRIDGYAAKKLSNTTTVSGANKAKRALQDTARSSYGTPNASAKKEAEKIGARKLRVAIEANTGGRSGTVAKLNAREAKLISAAKAIAQAVEREANQNPLYGVKTLASGALGGGVGYEQGGTPGAIAGTLAMRGALRPAFATKTAIVATRIAKQLGVGMATATRLASYALGEGGEEDGQ